MSYNILNYPGNDTTTRNPYFREICSSVSPDIIVVQEIQSQQGVDGFKSNVLLNQYETGTFINGPDTDNAIFYKPEKFQFISDIPIQTALRNISQFTLVHIPTNDTLILFSVHLKASSGSSNELQRAAEIDSLRKITNALHSSADFILLGDFNIYHSGEPAYLKILDQSQPGYFIDPQPLSGTWNNSSHSQYHTQSPRTRSFGGGANGGMDDRFDMILFSQTVWDSGGIMYVPGSTISYGNDGLHYNDSINQPPNTSVNQQIANALHYASDHIPVLVTLRFEQTNFQSVVNIIDGWNILSVPLLAPDMTTTTLFPTSTSQFFGYNGNYNSVNVLENGKGYWGKFSGIQNQIVSGTIVNQNEIAVNEGWNQIGVFDYDVPVSSLTTIPSGILATPFYSYNNGYQAVDTLKPGKGYWIKSFSNGIIEIK